MTALIRRFAKDRSGATALEYGLIIAMVSITIIVAAVAIGGSLTGKWDFVKTETAK